MRTASLIALAGFLVSLTQAKAFELGDCWQTKDPALEIAACTHFIESGSLNADQLPKAHTGRGVGLARSGRLDEAIAEHSKAIELAPGYPLPLVNRGSAWSARGDFAKAIDDFDAALRLDPANAGALNNRAWARLKLGDAAGALPDALEAAKLKPKAAAVHDTLGAVLAALGRRDEAIDAFKRALEIDPALVSATQALARLGSK
jgi:tetratricopeptide (TPR) repeat protein